MDIKKFILTILITVSVPFLFYFAFWIAEDTPYMSLWSDFVKGMYIGLCITGFPLGAFLSGFYNKKICSCKRGMEKRYSA